MAVPATYALIALPLWAITLGVWHLPALYEASLDDPGVQALQCVTLLAGGLGLWLCLLGPLPAPPNWFGERARIAAILTSRLLAAILANVLLWSDAVFYSHYARGDALHGLSPLADQNIAGAVVLGLEALMTLVLLSWLLLRTASFRIPRRRSNTTRVPHATHGAYAAYATHATRAAHATHAAHATATRAAHVEPSAGAYGHSEALL